MGGELAIDDQVWLRARLYDPAGRSFTTPDPLPGVVGRPCVGNPYHFGANDPLNQLDPSGMRPLTEADLDKIRSDWDSTAWDRYGGYVVGGLMIAGGIALMATGVGGVAGAALIGGTISGGISAVSQQALNGEVNWTRVGVDTVLGAATGGGGAWASGAMRSTALVGRLGPVGQRVLLESTENVVGGLAGRALEGQNPFNPKSLGLDVLTGGAVPTAGGTLGKYNDNLVQVEAGVGPLENTADIGGSFLYRGVDTGHPQQIAEARLGIARPRGGHTDPRLHNGGNTASEYTSWTRDPEIAVDCALECNDPGVVLRIPDADGPGYTLVPSVQDIYDESEQLIQGEVRNADVFDPIEFGRSNGYFDDW